MLKRFSEFALVTLTGLCSVAPVLAQNSTSQIDSEHSTARLYLASTRTPDSKLNVGVARASGVIKLDSGDPATPDFDFTIYPADKKPSLANSVADRRREQPHYTYIPFTSRRGIHFG